MSETTLGGTYRIVRKIGAGAMADVYEVEHARLGSRFAAKVARALGGEEATHRRFFREARMLASLRSDHIVTVFDVSGPDVEPPFMVMELLNGQDLRQLLRTSPELSVGRAVKIAEDVCLGLIAVHAAGVVHRDLKPENLFVTHRDTGEECCKLLDFGVVKAAQGTSTQHGGLIGTIKYMAPEQIEHAGTVTALSDVRSVAAILYECLVGRPPFEAPTVERLLFQVLHEQPEPIRSLRPDVPEELERVVMRALERDPSRRFPGARAFADALRPFIAASGDVVGEVTLDGSDPHALSGSATPTRTRRLPWLFGLPAVAGALALLLFLRSNASPATPVEQGVRSPAREATATPSTLLPAASEPAPVARVEPPAAAPAPAPAPRAQMSSAQKRSGAGKGTSEVRAPKPSHDPVRASAAGLRIDPTSPYDP